LLTDSILDLHSSLESFKKHTLQTVVEHESKMRDFKYTLDFYKDDMLAHEERVNQILEKEFQANRAKWLKEKANW
jgi:hypothetical protein